MQVQFLNFFEKNSGIIIFFIIILLIFINPILNNIRKRRETEKSYTDPLQIDETWCGHNFIVKKIEEGKVLLHILDSSRTKSDEFWFKAINFPTNFLNINDYITLYNSNGIIEFKKK